MDRLEVYGGVGLPYWSNAILVPSGATAGMPLPPSVVVRMALLLPSMPILATWRVPPASSTKATLFPSGKKSGSVSPAPEVSGCRPLPSAFIR